MATKISLKQLGDDILKLLMKTGNALLEKEIISNIQCGAAPSGTKFPQGQTFTEFAEKLLRKDITPTISTSFSGSGLHEIGSSVNGSTLILNITNLNSVTVPIDSINFYANNTLINTQSFSKEKSVYQFVYNNTITSDVTLKAELVFNSDQKIYRTGSFYFVYASYYGKTNLSNITDSDATAMASSFNKIVKNVKDFTWENIDLNDQRFCYLYPSSLGLLTDIKDGNGFSQFNGYTKYTVNLTSPADGNTVQYCVYLLTDPVTGSGFKQIYF